jgi:hypothetical protein
MTMENTENDNNKPALLALADGLVSLAKFSETRGVLLGEILVYLTELETLGHHRAHTLAVRARKLLR